jgi:NADH-quinone oxidoreductase subunit H
METNIVYTLLGNNILSILVIVVLPLIFLIVYALVAILGELKISAFIQERLGPMRTGPWGIIQPVAEVVKLLQKEDITPYNADKLFFNIAPYLIFAGSFAAFAVIPFSAYFVPAQINVGLFYIFAIGSFGVLGIMMGGWASNNKYSLLGALRSVSQIVSYEVPAAFALLSVAALAGTLDMQQINHAQSGYFWNWFIFGGQGNPVKFLFVPFLLILCLVYLISSLAETNRTPFDIPEGESELVAGYHTEYSGMKFAMFFFAEYANMFVVAAIMTIVFFGGWNSPFGDFLGGPILGVIWFSFKALCVVFVQIWLRWTLPRFRVDQLMNLGWKVLIPISFVCFFAVAFLAMIK